MQSLRSKENLVNIAPVIHHAALDPHLSIDSLNQICDACIHFSIGGLCTNLPRISIARERISTSSQTKIIAVIAFPFGGISSAHKQAEAEWAAEKGADELDIVPNFFALKEQKLEEFTSEISTICAIGLPTRVILDCSNIKGEELSNAVEASIDAGAYGIQNNNGFGGIANPSDINLLSNFTKGRCEIKAVGKITMLDQLDPLIGAGANKIGTSCGLQILQDLRCINE